MALHAGDEHQDLQDFCLTHSGTVWYSLPLSGGQNVLLGAATMVSLLGSEAVGSLL